jgi:hypothetical protein
MGVAADGNDVVMVTLIKTRNKIPSSAGDGVGTGSTAHRIAIRKIDRVK